MTTTTTEHTLQPHGPAPDTQPPAPGTRAFGRTLGRRRRRASLLGAAFTALLATAATSAAASTPRAPLATGEPAPGSFTTLAATPVAPVHPVRGADGAQHLAYELQLIDPIRVTATIDRIETLDADTHEVLAVLDGPAIAPHLVLLPPAAPTTATIGPGATAYLVLDVALPSNAPLPRRLVHDITLTLSPDVPELPHVVRIGTADVARDRPVVIDAPLAGPRWFDFQGCCATNTSHRGAINLVDGRLQLSQRFAIDFVQLAQDGHLFTGPPDQLASYPYYGTNVYSVASGVVVHTQDGVPDNIPGTRPPVDVTQRTVPGNYVIVDIGGGHFAAYAHLQPGSLQVHVGDHVRRGAVLGRLGNSGNSDLPHLHFQVADGPLFFGADGLPYHFRSFTSEGTLTNPDDVISETGSAAIIGPALAGPHRQQLPLNLQVVNFQQP